MICGREALNRHEIPDLSVIVPVYNGSDTLAICLEALLASRGVRMEIIVVDDASSDDSAAVAAAYPVTLLRLSRRMGGGMARNPGAARARAPVLVFTDADVEVGPRTLASILTVFREDPGLAALFGAYTTHCPHGDFFTRYKNLHHHFHHGQMRRRVSTFWTGCGAVRKHVFQSCGGFRRLSHVYDIDLGYRMRRAGFMVEVVPGIQVTHHKRYTFGSLVVSDLLNRAVPWTRLMLEHRVFQNDLNTRGSQVASVLCLYAGLLGAFLFQPLSAKILGLCAGLAMVSALNSSWFRFCAREQGRPFALGALAMEWVYFFYSGLGALAGAGLYLFRCAFARRRECR